MIGLTAGASAGAVATAMVWPGLLPVAWGAAAGALLAMAAVWFGSGAGFAAPQRMVVAGIAVARWRWPSCNTRCPTCAASRPTWLPPG